MIGIEKIQTEFEISVLHVKNGKLKSLDVQLLYRMLMLESK